jgi:hypothetical protein
MTIAMSCNLTDSFTEVLVIEEVEKDKLLKQMEDFFIKVTTDLRHPYSLFVIGDSLIKITEFKLESQLVKIADHCTSFVRVYHKRSHAEFRQNRNKNWFRWLETASLRQSL